MAKSIATQKRIFEEMQHHLEKNGCFYCTDSDYKDMVYPIFKCTIPESVDYLSLHDGMVDNIDVLCYIDGEFSLQDNVYVDLDDGFRFATQEEIEDFESLVIVTEMA